LKGDIEDLIQKLLFCISQPLNYEMDWRDNQEAKEVMKQKVLQNLQYALNSLKKRDLMQRLSQPEDFKIEPLDQLEFGRWLKNRQPRKHDAHLNKLMFRSKRWAGLGTPFSSFSMGRKPKSGKIDWGLKRVIGHLLTSSNDILDNYDEWNMTKWINNRT